MKSIYKIPTACLLAASLLFSVGCQDLLEEEVKTAFTADYFTTPDGLEAAIVSAYANLRFIYGPNGAIAVSTVGTDEWTYGDQPRTGQDNDVLQLGTYNVTSTQGSVQTPWNRSFSTINLMNGIINGFAEAAPVSDAVRQRVLGEAHFMRALNYLNLVQYFGKVPLNLGSGDLMFNTNPTNEFFRLGESLLAENYQVIINDAIAATQLLPDQRPETNSRASKAAAYHLLAKAYLFRGYSSVAQAGDFQKAYEAAMELINNKAKYGVALEQNFADVFKHGNTVANKGDYNREVIFSVERLPLNNDANETRDPGSDFSNKVNIANNMFNADYTAPSLRKPDNSTFKAIPNRVMQYGRPLRRYVPTPWLVHTAFADKVNDSRYNGSFRTVWYAATNDEAGSEGYNTYVENLASIGLALGDTVIYLTSTDEEAAALRAKGKKYAIYAPSEWYTNQGQNSNIFPNLSKYEDPNRGHFNDVSGRPFKVFRFAETYLIAAEAAMQMGQTQEAANLINVLRKRAAFRPSLTTEQVDARYAKIEVGAADIDLDFILAERSRELAGESVRWPDLAVRGVLVDRVKAHNVDAAANVKDFHVLRPIPQPQLDAVGDPDKSKYQNPGY